MNPNSLESMFADLDRRLRPITERLELDLAGVFSPQWRPLRHRESRHRRRFAARTLTLLEPPPPRAHCAPELVAAAVLRRRTCTRSV